MINTTTQRLSLLREEGNLVVLTGAGISAESGIPTFRGEEGYWTEGSSVFTPMEMATNRMFQSHPQRVWAWYLMRRDICLKANPNRGHQALVSLQQALGPRFVLVTQNVDGLHPRAGSTPTSTHEIHGNIHTMRCSADCGGEPMPVPPQSEIERPTGRDWNMLHCTHCGQWMRPHVLWFDECYNEEWYRYETAMQAAADADALVVVGTSGSTNLPLAMANLCARQGALIVDINPQANRFTPLAKARGDWLAQSASEGLRELEILLA